MQLLGNVHHQLARSTVLQAVETRIRKTSRRAELDILQLVKGEGTAKTCTQGEAASTAAGRLHPLLRPAQHALRPHCPTCQMNPSITQAHTVVLLRQQSHCCSTAYQCPVIKLLHPCSVANQKHAPAVCSAAAPPHRSGSTPRAATAAWRHARAAAARPPAAPWRPLR